MSRRFSFTDVGELPRRLAQVWRLIPCRGLPIDDGVALGIQAEVEKAMAADVAARGCDCNQERVGLAVTVSGERAAVCTVCLMIYPLTDHLPQDDAMPQALPARSSWACRAAAAVIALAAAGAAALMADQRLCERVACWCVLFAVVAALVWSALMLFR